MISNYISVTQSLDFTFRGKAEDMAYFPKLAYGKIDLNKV